MFYLGKCSLCTRKECVFCICQVACSTNVSLSKLVEMFKSSISLVFSVCLIYQLLKGVLISATMKIIFFSLFRSVGCFMHFESQLTGGYTLRIIMPSWFIDPFYHGEISLFILDNTSYSEVYFFLLLI